MDGYFESRKIKELKVVSFEHQMIYPKGLQDRMQEMPSPFLSSNINCFQNPFEGLPVLRSISTQKKRLH